MRFALNEQLKQLIERKRAWAEAMHATDRERGFKGWYVSGGLPHCDQPGLHQYVSYRLHDSMPWERRAEWEALRDLENSDLRSLKIEEYLDRGYGAGYLRDPRVAEIVQANWWHHDGLRYRLLAWVIMPNHVHVLLEIWQVPLGRIVQSWKSYSAKQANRVLHRQGGFWSEDYFDRYVRDEEHFRRVVRYIELNPVKAKLIPRPEEWKWSSARYRGEPGAIVPCLTHPTARRVPTGEK